MSTSNSLTNQLQMVFANITKKTVIGMENGLRMSASLLRNEAIGIAPHHIGQHIQISPVYSFRDPAIAGSSPAPDNPQYHREISIYVKLSDAPDARAWEYGSGLHDVNTPHLIPIAARNAPLLKFWWANQNKWFKGRALPYGHPGIVGRSYLRQPLQDNAESIRQMIAQYIQEANSV